MTVFPPSPQPSPASGRGGIFSENRLSYLLNDELEPVWENNTVYHSPEADPSKLYTKTAGDGPDIVLLHGWGMHSGVWQDIVPSLIGRYRVTVVDLPGHGYSRLSTTSKTLSDLSQAVAASAPTEAIWVGWSLGGLVAQHLAVNAPERVAKLVLVASSPCFVQRADWPHAMAPAVLDRFVKDLSKNARATLKRFFALQVYGSEYATEQLRWLRAVAFQHGEPKSDVLRDGLGILENTDLRNRLTKVACPTLLLLGQHDNLVPVAAGAAIRDLLADTRLHVFQGAGHTPFCSHRSEFVDQLRVFLND